MDNWQDIFKIGGAIILSFGGAAVVLFALSSYLGKIWANRILEQDRTKYQSELENYKTQLEITKLSLSRYSEYQFKSYNELWFSLIELKIAAEHLWDELNVVNLKSFIKQLEQTKINIQTKALLIEESHYEQLKIILDRFDHYQIGKIKLMDIRDKRTNDISLAAAIDEYQVINDNGEDKKRYEVLLSDIECSFRKQLRSTTINNRAE